MSKLNINRIYDITTNILDDVVSPQMNCSCLNVAINLDMLLGQMPSVTLISDVSDLKLYH